jgi:hypothetical protein
MRENPDRSTPNIVSDMKKQTKDDLKTTTTDHDKRAMTPKKNILRIKTRIRAGGEQPILKGK